MEGVIATPVTADAKRRVQDDTEKQLLADIEAVRKGLEMATVRFNFQEDPDLLEASIYEMQALTARYRYLTREAKRLGLTRSTLLSLKRLDD